MDGPGPVIPRYVRMHRVIPKTQVELQKSQHIRMEVECDRNDVMRRWALAIVRHSLATVKLLKIVSRGE